MGDYDQNHIFIADLLPNFLMVSELNLKSVSCGVVVGGDVSTAA